MVINGCCISRKVTAEEVRGWYTSTINQLKPPSYVLQLTFCMCLNLGGRFVFPRYSVIAVALTNVINICMYTCLCRLSIVSCTLCRLCITDVRDISLSDRCPYFLLHLFSERYTGYKSKRYRLCNIHWLKDNTLICWSDCSSSEHWHTFFYKLLYRAYYYVPLCNSLLCVKTKLWCSTC